MQQGRSKEGRSNYAYKTGEGDDDNGLMLSRISTSDLAASIERLASDPALANLAARDMTTRDAIKSLRGLLNDQRFQKSFQFAQKVIYFCASNIVYYENALAQKDTR